MQRTTWTHFSCRTDSGSEAKILSDSSGFPRLRRASICLTFGRFRTKSFSFPNVFPSSPGSDARLVRHILRSDSLTHSPFR